LPRLYERDIDVLLQEELLFNDNVRSLFTSALGLDGSAVVHHCELSVVDISGETDILASLVTVGEEIAILIENKIDAIFQPRQPERYRERAAFLVAKKRCSRSFCVLVAPRQYADTEKRGIEHFDAILFYEDIAATMRLENTPRSMHRATLLLRAVQQARKTYTLAPVAEIGALWRRIYQIARSKFPLLGMQAPGEKGAGSHWLLFKADLPPRITIDWKIKQATVDLSFWKGAVHRPRQGIDLSNIRGNASLMGLNDTTVIRLTVPGPPQAWTELSSEQIENALSAASELYMFYRDNPNSFT
jgi:hypothetical protein